MYSFFKVTNFFFPLPDVHHEMDVGLHGWGPPPGVPVICTKRYTINQRAHSSDIFFSFFFFPCLFL